MLKFLVNELDIASLRKKFESTEYFIPKSENSSLVIEIMLNCGLKKYSGPKIIKNRRNLNLRQDLSEPLAYF